MNRRNPFNLCLPFLACLLPLAVAGSGRASEQPDPDEELLQAHKINRDGPALLDFFRARTLTTERQARINELLAELNHPRFAVREQATKELTRLGVAALRPLRAARTNADAEVVRRVLRCIADIEAGPGVELPMAALHVLRKQPPAGTVAVLLAYLPDADDRALEDEVLHALAAVGIRAGRPDPLLVEARADGPAARRSAAGFVLGRSSDPQQRKLAADLLGDPEPWVRLRAAQGLVAGRDKAGVSGLVDLVARPSSDLTWPAEELLRRLAGEKSPDPPADDTEKAREAYRDTWAKWWADNAAKVDLSAVTEETRPLGFTLGIEWNTNRVWECGIDKKLRWELRPDGPMDAQVLPGERVLIAEANSRRVTERDRQGNVLWEKKLGDEEPINCQRLSNGHTFIGTRHRVMEVRRDGSEVFKHTISDVYLHAVRRLPNGHFVGLTSGGLIHEIDARGQTVRKVQVPHEGTWGDVDALGGGRYLVANYGAGFVREVDSAGKMVWEVKAPDCCGLERLPGGQFLLGCGTRIIVVDRSGKALWETTGQGSNRRVHRR